MAAASTSSMTSPTNTNGTNGRTPSSSSGGSFLTKYFLVILFGFACMSLILNSQFTHIVSQDASIIEHYLKDSVQALVVKQKFLPLNNMVDDGITHEPPTEEDSPSEGDHEVENKHVGLANPHASRIAGLNCDKYGGPSVEEAQEMVYWEDIPSDAEWISPFHSKNRNDALPQYLTFEPDQGGWNNIRMAMETVLAMAFAMGRTLVLPPHQEMYLLTKKDSGQRNAFSFEHFFHMERIHEEHMGLDVISMKEFLEIAMKGVFVDPSTGQPMFPPGNRTDWDGSTKREVSKLNNWLRNNITNTVMRWNPEKCLAAFPRSTDQANVDEMKRVQSHIMENGGMPKFETYIGKPTPVDGDMEERLKESSAQRTELCLYDKPLQAARWLHFPMQHQGVSHPPESGFVPFKLVDF